MCAGATWLDAIIMFQLLLFGIVWALCIALALGGATLSRYRVQGFGVFALTFAGKRYVFPVRLYFEMFSQ